MENESDKSDFQSVQTGQFEQPYPKTSYIQQDNLKLFELLESIKSIEEYLYLRESSRKSYDTFLFSDGRSSFLYWVKETYRRRFLRSSYFNSEYFSGEAAWNILLDLAAAYIEGKRISVTSACIASGVPTTTALRWISVLEADGIVEKECDYSDKRRTFLRVSEKGLNLMFSYYNDLHLYSKHSRKQFKQSNSIAAPQR